MKRLAALLAALLIAVTAVVHHPPRAFAVTFPAGWNLVSGPEGALLVGAADPLYTFQAGDTAYESLPARTPLKACVGYWAYFPTGGGMSGGSDRTSCAVESTDGGLAMIGNPSASGGARPIGYDTLLTYDPVAGYVAAATLAPGQGAWIVNEDITAVLATVVTPPASPSPTPYVSPTPRPPCVDGQYGANTAGSGCQVRGETTPTAFCQDGTYDYSRSFYACAAHGGVLYYLPISTPPPSTLNPVGPAASPTASPTVTATSTSTGSGT